MSLENIVTLIAAGLAFAASLMATAVAIYNTRFRRFALEKWWERKAEAYTRIIEALADMVNYYQQIGDAEVRGRELPEERRQEIDEHWKQGYREVVKATNIGAFLISSEAEASLRRFREGPKEKPHPDDWFQQLDNSYAGAKQCLKELVACAKEDLRVSRWLQS